MAIGMNKGRGVGRAKAGIGVPKKTGPQAPNVANGSKFKPIPGGPTQNRPKSPSSAKPYGAPRGPGRGGQMKKMGGK